MDRETEIGAPLEHPGYAGHFPGNPVVPGVVLLDLVVEAVNRGAPSAIGSVKFHRVVRPGDVFTLRYELDGTKLAFRCIADDRLLAEGTMTLAAGAGA